MNAVDNLAAILYGIDDLRVENFPIPAQVPDGHVRIAIKAVGICGSDVHYWKKVISLVFENFCTQTLLR